MKSFISANLSRVKRLIKRYIPGHARSTRIINAKLRRAEKLLNQSLRAIDRRLSDADELFETNVSSSKGQIGEALSAEIARQLRALKKETNDYARILNGAASEMSRIESSKRLIEVKTADIGKKMKLMRRGYYYGLNLDPSMYRDGLELWYENRVGGKLNLDNPRLFNEKLQWLKLYDSTPLKTRLADKYEVRAWVRGLIGDQYLIPLIGVWYHYDEIDFETLPERFALKCTHGCKWNLIVKDKQAIDHLSAKNKFERWLSTNHAFNTGYELHYKDIPPRIIAEEYLENSDNDLHDYKIWCFDGVPAYIQHISTRKTGAVMTYFDTQWNVMPFITNFKRSDNPVPKPERLEELLALAGALSKGFCVVRVDFYVLNDNSIKFGEMTFTPSSGKMKWDPPEYNQIIGDMVKLERLPQFSQNTPSTTSSIITIT